jgi:outer membrane protein assembly factor BamB
MRKFCLLIGFFLSLLVSQHVLATSLRVGHASCGPTTALVIDDNYWYQAVGGNLHVLQKNGGALVSTVQLASPATAICTELLMEGNLLYALLEGNEVLVFDVINPLQPELIRTRTSDALGILPHHFATLENEPVVLGKGGVVALRDGKRIISCDGEVSSAAKSKTEGVVYVKDNVIVGSRSGNILGHAAQLIEFDASANVDNGTILYVRDHGDETEIGLLAGDLQPIASARSRKNLEGVRTNVLVRGSRIFVTTTTGIYVLGIAPKELRLLRTFALEGVESIGILASNYFALSGNFGRGVFRISEDSGGAGETLFRIVPSHGTLGAGVYDARTLQVPTETGSVLYRFGEPIELLADSIVPIEIQTSAIVLGCEAKVDSRSGDVTLSTSTGNALLEFAHPAVTVIARGGDFWFGTEDGVVVCKQTSDGEFRVFCSVQLAGPIVQLIPLLDGGVGFVSAAGFVGTLEEIHDEVALEQ